ARARIQGAGGSDAQTDTAVVVDIQVGETQFTCRDAQVHANASYTIAGLTHTGGAAGHRVDRITGCGVEGHTNRLYTNSTGIARHTVVVESGDGGCAGGALDVDAGSGGRDGVV